MNHIDIPHLKWGDNSLDISSLVRIDGGIYHEYRKRTFAWGTGF